MTGTSGAVLWKRLFVRNTKNLTSWENVSFPGRIVLYGGSWLVSILVNRLFVLQTRIKLKQILLPKSCFIVNRLDERQSPVSVICMYECQNCEELTYMKLLKGGVMYVLLLRCKIRHSKLNETHNIQRNNKRNEAYDDDDDDDDDNNNNNNNNRLGM